MAPYLLLGFIIAGLLNEFLPQKSIYKFLKKKNLKSSINAAIVGVPLPLCSCGVIPTGISFYKSGASKGATTSFLISTPQTGIDSVMATTSLLGLPFALIRVVVAFVSGIIGGSITNVFDKDPNSKIAESKNQTVSTTSTKKRVYRAFHYAFVEFFEDIAKWLVIGLLIAALFSVVIPNNFFEQYLTNTSLDIPVILLASIPLYVCATGSVPIAAVLLAKGISPGAAFVFLMAGPATNAGTITVISKYLGKKTTLIYLGSIIGTAIITGYLINQVFPTDLLKIPASITSQEHHQNRFYSIIEIISTIFLIALIIRAAYSKLFRKSLPKTKKETGIMKKTIKVKGMSCNHCKSSVEKTLSGMEGITNVDVLLQEEQVVLSGEKINLKEVEKKIEGIGFEYAGEE